MATVCAMNTLLVAGALLSAQAQASIGTSSLPTNAVALRGSLARLGNNTRSQSGNGPEQVLDTSSAFRNFTATDDVSANVSHLDVKQAANSNNITSGGMLQGMESLVDLTTPLFTETFELGDLTDELSNQSSELNQTASAEGRRLWGCYPVGGICFINAQCCSARCVATHRCGPPMWR